MNIIPRSQQKCGNCDAFVRAGSQQKAGICVARSPVPIMVHMTNPAANLDPKQPQVIPVVQGMFPAIEEHRWCRQWCMKVEGSS